VAILKPTLESMIDSMHTTDDSIENLKSRVEDSLGKRKMHLMRRFFRFERLREYLGLLENIILSKRECYIT